MTCVTWPNHHKHAWYAYISHRNQLYVGLLRGEYVLWETHSYAWHDSFTTMMRDMPISLIAIHSTLAFSMEKVFYEKLIYTRALTRSPLWCVTYLHLSSQSILRWPSPWGICSLTWLIHVCDMTHAPQRMRYMTLSLLATNSTSVFSVENVFYQSLIHMHDMTHSQLWCVTCLHLSSQSILHRPSPWRMCSTNRSFICMTWLIHNLDAWHAYISHCTQFQVGLVRGKNIFWRDSFICVTWLIHHNDAWQSSSSSQLILRRSSP